MSDQVWPGGPFRQAGVSPSGDIGKMREAWEKTFRGDYRGSTRIAFRPIEMFEVSPVAYPAYDGRRPSWLRRAILWIRGVFK
jgi:hypothetical protein